MTTSIGVVTTCHTYTHFLEPWLISVNNLKRQPDKVVIAATDPDTVQRLADGIRGGVIVLPAPKPWSWGSALNAAVAGCDTEWITWIGVDDTYLPIALSGWEDFGNDIVCFGLQTTNGYVRRVDPPPTREQVMDTRNRNLIPCGSPFRRWVWEQTPFDPVNFTPYEDWAFGVQAMYRGASIGSTLDIDYIYTVHPEQVSATAPREATFAERLNAWMKEQGYE